MTPTDTLNDAFGRLNVEGAAFTDRHASQVGSGLLPRGNGGLHHVARGEPVNAFLARQIAAREAVLVDPRALIAPPSRATDLKDAHPLGIVHPVHPARAERVEPVLFGNAERMAVELRQCARTRFDGKAEGLQRVEERPTRCVDRRRVRERSPELALDAIKHFGTTCSMLSGTFSAPQ